MNPSWMRFIFALHICKIYVLAFFNGGRGPQRPKVPKANKSHTLVLAAFEYIVIFRGVCVL